MVSIARIRSRLADTSLAGTASDADETPGRRASVAIVLCGDRDAPSVCFVVRARRPGDPWSGDVAFPGGWAKREAESLRDAAMRETREEIGLVLADAHHVGDMAPMSISRFDPGIGIIGASVFHIGESLPSLDPDQREIVRAFWAPLAALHHPDYRTVVHWSRSGPPAPRPASEFDGHVIWGLT